jgi:hypothetical protein
LLDIGIGFDTIPYMPTDEVPPDGNPAIAFLTKQRDGYAAALKRLKAQHKGVEAKMFSTEAKLESIEEALKALSEMPPSAN